MSLLTDRASALREFFRLVDADADDDDLTEHDASTLEGAYEALDVGAARAQLFLIGIGQGERWLTVGSALSVTGSDPTRYALLPANFLRLDSDKKQRRSGLRYANGNGWGCEVRPGERHGAGNYYWVEWDETAGTDLARVRFNRGASVPSGLVPHYYRRIAALADGTNIEMRKDDRPLVHLYAADYAKDQSWFPGGDEQRAAIQRALGGAQKEAYARGRLTRSAREIETTPSVGHWML